MEWRSGMSVKFVPVRLRRYTVRMNGQIHSLALALDAVSAKLHVLLVFLL
jgi:hypothetical protein